MYEMLYGLAERARFELADPYESAVFKTARGTQGYSTPRSQGNPGVPRLTPDSMYESMYGPQTRPTEAELFRAYGLPSEAPTR